MDHLVETVALGPQRLRALLRFLLPARKDVWIAGQPGVGKTDLVTSVCAELGLDLLRHPPGVSMDPVDVRGLPFIEQGPLNRTRWAQADLWPTQERAAQSDTLVIFLDELSQAPLAVQAAYMQVVQNRRLGEMTLPDNVCFVAAGNRPEDRAGANRVITPLVSRFAQLELVVSNQDWLDWARLQELDQDVIGTIAYKPDILNTFDPKKNQAAYACPRTWHKLADALAANPEEELIAPLASSYVGHGPGAIFTTFRQTRRELPDLEVVWENPEQAPMPQDKPVVLYAMALALAEMSKQRKVMDALGIYGKRLPGEVSAFLLTEVFRANCPVVQSQRRELNPKLASSKPVMAWLMSHKDVLPDLLR